jgi:hypothetical protein
VSCDVCHKIADIPLSGQNFPGIYPGVVTFTRPLGPDFHPVQYGLLGDVDFEHPIKMRASYQPQLVAEVCGACHQDKNDPDQNENFDEPNGVISEPTYFEWADSDYADPESPYFATCLDCHMPANAETEACNAISLPRPAGSLRSHTIRGTTAEYLENAVELDLVAQLVDDTVEVEASITNSLTGHHVPTGVTVRNMILLIEAWREEDDLSLTHTGVQTVHDLGGIGDPAQGYYAGLPGKYFSKLNHDATLNGPTFFTDATGIIFDNRIAALATDVSNYTFDAPAGGGTVRVRARLIYRRAFRFLVDAKQWTEDGHGQPLEDIAPPHFGHLMEMEEEVVDLCPGGPPAAIDDSVRLERDGTDAVIHWDDLGLGGPFNVYRGSRDGAPFVYDHVCFDGPATPTSTDTDLPANHQVRYYLVSRRGCGESDLGSGTPGARPNDSPCPLN